MQGPSRPLNFYHLEVFYAVARHLNFSRAAEELYISQPAVSKHVKDLEKDLGVDLFRRNGRRVELTDAGRLVYDYAGHALVLTEGLRRALVEMHSPGHGYLRLAATHALATYVVPRVLATFQVRYPDVQLSLQVSSKGTTIRQVLQHQADLGIIDCHAIPSDVQWQRFARVPIVLLASPNHQFSGGGIVDLVELSQETIITEEKGSDTREALERELERLRVRPAQDAGDREHRGHQGGRGGRPWRGVSPEDLRCRRAEWGRLGRARCAGVLAGDPAGRRLCQGAPPFFYCAGVCRLAPEDNCVPGGFLAAGCGVIREVNSFERLRGEVVECRKCPRLGCRQRRCQSHPSAEMQTMREAFEAQKVQEGMPLV